MTPAAQARPASVPPSNRTALLAEAHRTLERPHEPLLARDARVLQPPDMQTPRHGGGGCFQMAYDARL
jgi:hypothetical protein